MAKIPFTEAEKEFKKVLDRVTKDTDYTIVTRKDANN